jgi:hypothetical protein
MTTVCRLFKQGVFVILGLTGLLLLAEIIFGEPGNTSRESTECFTFRRILWHPNPS